MQARGLAALGHARECIRLLTRAEGALGTARHDGRSPWISAFDKGSLASEAARCLHQLGDLSEARRQAELVVELRPAERVRSRAFGQLILATVLIAQGKPDEACAMTRDTVLSTQSLGSYLVVQQLLDLTQLLGPYRADPAVRCFLGQLDDVLHERIWLHQLVAADGRGGQTGDRRVREFRRPALRTRP
jgi:Tetratricopeptide repeat.